MPEGEINGGRGASFSGHATNVREVGLLEGWSFVQGVGCYMAPERSFQSFSRSPSETKLWGIPCSPCSITPGFLSFL